MPRKKKDTAEVPVVTAKVSDQQIVDTIEKTTCPTR